jgi:hypothetical protein
MSRLRQVCRLEKSVQLAGNVNKWLYSALSLHAEPRNRARETRGQYAVVVGDVFEAIGKVRP